MKINRIELLEALTKVKPGLASMEIIEQSTSFVFINNMIVTYNDDIATSMPFTFDKKEIKGAVQSNELYGLLNKVKDKEVKVIIKGNEFKIFGNNFKSGITLESDIQLPIDFFEIEKSNYIKLPENFNDLLKLCLISSLKEPSGVLNNIHLYSNIIESCDNFRLTRIELENKIKKHLLIPDSAASQIVNNGYQFKDVCINKGWLHFREKKSGLIFSCRTMDNKYPDLNPLLEVKGKTLKFPEQLNDILSRSKVFSTDNEQVVKIILKDNKCTVYCENDNGWIEEKTDIKIKDSTDIEFKINSNYLLDILKQTNKVKIGERAIKFFNKEYEHVIAMME